MAWDAERAAARGRHRDRARHLHRRRRGLRDRAAVRPQDAGHPGLDAFPGKVFHSARWDHDYDLTGKRVAMIGTGASAIQIVPSIQPKVDRLTLIQRTPAWVMPRIDRADQRRRTGPARALPADRPSCRRGLLWRHPGTPGAGVHQAPRTSWASSSRSPGATCGGRDQGPGPARQAHPRLPHRLQADPAGRAPTTRRSPGPIWTWSRAALSRGARVDAGRRRRYRGRGRTRSSSAPASTSPTCRSRERVVGADGRTLAETWKGGMEALRGGTAAGIPQLHDGHRAQHRPRQLVR